VFTAGLLLAMVVNDDAGNLTLCVALRFFASGLAPAIKQVAFNAKVVPRFALFKEAVMPIA
jgi:hypothetical protein